MSSQEATPMTTDEDADEFKKELGAATRKLNANIDIIISKYRETDDLRLRGKMCNTLLQIEKLNSEF